MDEARAHAEPGEIILSSGDWPTNAHLIRDVAKLGYLDGHVLDPTYGKGGWWKLWTPAKLTRHDLDEEKGGDGVSFHDLPHPDGTFDAVTYDPMYVAPGGRETSTIRAMHKRYGMDMAPKTPHDLYHFNLRGFVECCRVLRVGGFIIYKSQDYITSGTLQAVTNWIWRDATKLGMEYVDRFEHVTHKRPQPSKNRDGSPRRQVHSHRNLSTLLVFRKRRY